MESNAGGILKEGKTAILFTLRESRGYPAYIGGISQAQPASPMPAPPGRGSFTLEGQDLRHPRLLQRWGLFRVFFCSIKSAVSDRQLAISLKKYLTT